MAVYSCHIGAFITSCHAWYTSVVGDEREHQLCSQLGSRVQFLQSLRASSSWATLGQWLRLSEPELSLCNRTHTSPYFTELLKEFPETIYKEWWTQRSKCPINICGESSQEQRHFFFFIHYRVLTQMHPSLVFDTVSLSKFLLHLSSDLYSAVRQKWCHQSFDHTTVNENLFISAHFSKDNSKNLLGGGSCLWPTLLLHLLPWFPSLLLSPTWPISPSFLHYPQRRTFAHAIFSNWNILLSPPRLVNLFSSFAVIHPILPQQQLSGPPWPCQIPPCMISSPLGRLLCFIMTGLRISCPHLDQRDEGRKCLVLLTSWIPPDLIFKRSTTTPGPGIEPNKCCWMGEKEGEPEGILSPQKPSCAPLGHSGYYWFFR